MKFTEAKDEAFSRWFGTNVSSRAPNTAMFFHVVVNAKLINTDSLLWLLYLFTVNLSTSELKFEETFSG